MKILDGNSYVCIKECKDIKGRTINVGAICHASKDFLLYGYCADGIYTQIEHMDDYGEYFTLYEETPYNKEQKELRRRYAGLAMQALIPFYEGNPAPRTYPDDCAKAAVEYADALIAELRKEKD